MSNDFRPEQITGGHLSDDQIIALLYAEAPVEIQQHLEDCGTCRNEFEAYHRTLQTLQHWPTPPRPPEYESQVWRRVSDLLPPKPQSLWSRIPSRVLGMAAAIAAIAIVSLLVRRMAPDRRPSVPLEQASAPADDRVLQVAVRDHLEHTFRVLSELKNSTLDDGVRFVDISDEQNAIEDLIAENRLYRQTAQQDGRSRTAELLDDVEQLLLELEHSPSRLSKEQLEAMQQRLSDAGVLFKLKVLTSSGVKSSNLPTTKL